MIMQANTSTEIGRVIGTERKPSTAYTFQFWARPRERIGIGSIVRVEAVVDDAQVTVYGIVVEAFAFNDLESPLHEFLSMGGDATITPPTMREDIRMFQAAVLRREPEEPVGAVPIGRVYLASEDDVQKALRTNEFREQFGIACGCYGGKDNPVPVHLHRDFLLGSEAGHLNITGTSGLAAKTSYILFLLKSIFTHSKTTPGAPTVATLLFNTKGGDLLYLDKDPEHVISPDQLEIYLRCGIEPTPFENVEYYAPYKHVANGELNTVRFGAEVEAGNPTRPFAFGLQDIMDNFEVLVGREDLDAKAAGFLGYLKDKYVLAQGKLPGSGGERQAKTLGELTDIIKIELRQADNGEGKGVQHPLTMRKVLNRLTNLQHRYSGLISHDGKTLGPLSKRFEPGSVVVVDVSQLHSDAKDLVFSAFISQIQDLMEDRKLGVDRLIVVVDELNKYAPSGGGETYVLSALKDISARGRYMGLTLFGAQQFRSRVDKEVVGNSASHAFGHIEAEELAQPGYSYFTPAVKEKLATLPTGEVLIKHPHFAQPIFVRFPIPPCLRGSDGLRKYPRAADRSLRELVAERARQMRGNPNEIADLLSKMAEDNDMANLLRELHRAPLDADALAIIRQYGKVSVAPRKEPRAVLDDDVDPFA